MGAHEGHSDLGEGADAVDFEPLLVERSELVDDSPEDRVSVAHVQRDEVLCHAISNELLAPGVGAWERSRGRGASIQGCWAKRGADGTACDWLEGLGREACGTQRWGERRLERRKDRRRDGCAPSTITTLTPSSFAFS